MTWPRTVAAGAALQLRVSALTPMSAVSSSLTPLGTGILLYSGADVRTFGGEHLVAAAFIAIWSTLLIQSVLAVIQERNWGTMGTLASTPAGVVGPLLGRVLASLVHGLISAALVVLVLAVLVPEARVVPSPAQLFLLFTATVGYGGIALGLVAWILRYRYASGSVNGVFEVALLFSGSYVAVSAFPGGLRQVGYLFPAVRLEAPDAVSLVSQSALALVWLAAGLGMLAAASRAVGSNGKALLQ